MTEPEQALQVARQRATAMRAAGAYAVSQSASAPDTSAGASRDKLLEWAVIKPDLRELRSSRRMGGSLTVVRHLLIRLLWPYHSAQLADQSRFNVELLLHLRTLQARLDELERQLGGKPAPATQSSPSDP